MESLARVPIDHRRGDGCRRLWRRDKAATGPGTGGTPGTGSADTVLSAVSGDSQTATMGTRLANPLVVRVVDAKGNPMTGVTVDWAVAAGSGSIPATSVTNASGQASAQWTLDNTYMGDSAVAFGGGALGGVRGVREWERGPRRPATLSRRQCVERGYLRAAGRCQLRDVHRQLRRVEPAPPGLRHGVRRAPNGIPYVVVHGTQPRVPVSFMYASESDPGPYPVPPYAPIEGGASSSGDRHVLTVDADAWQLYEMWAAYPAGGGSSWSAGSGAIFDLTSGALRPAGWTSADAAGLPILPGLVRYDEVVIHHAITHALRFTCPSTQNGYVAPARHEAGSANTALPPMGMRVRLKSSVDISGYSANLQVILRALQHYGMFVADNGSAFYLSGAPDPRWSDDELHGLTALEGSDFEVVQVGTISH